MIRILDDALILLLIDRWWLRNIVVVVYLGSSPVVDLLKYKTFLVSYVVKGSLNWWLLNFFIVILLGGLREWTTVDITKVDNFFLIILELILIDNDKLGIIITFRILIFLFIVFYIILLLGFRLLDSSIWTFSKLSISDQVIESLMINFFIVNFVSPHCFLLLFRSIN